MERITSPASQIRAEATNELRALELLLPEFDACPTVCATVIRVWYALTRMHAAERDDVAPTLVGMNAALSRGELDGLPGMLRAQGDAFVRSVVTCAFDPSGPRDAWPSTLELQRHRAALARSFRELDGAMRQRMPERFSSRQRGIGALVAAASFALLLAYLRAPGRKSWRVEFFRTQQLSDPSARTTSKTASGEWGTGPPLPGLPEDNFSARWSTCVDVKTATEITFVLGSDDGSRLIVDGQTKIDLWENHPYGEKVGAVAFSPGTHLLVVEYFEATGDARLTLRAFQEEEWARLSKGFTLPVEGSCSH